MLTIYGVPISVHTRKVIVTAKHKGLAYKIDPVIPFNPPENWRALSPTGLIPAISHDGFELADSNAICAYLERIRASPAIYPSDPQMVGRALWLEQYGTGVLFRQVVHPLFFQKIIRPHILKQGAPDAAEIERVVNDAAPRIFAYLENQIAGHCFIGDALSIADISIISNLININYLGFPLDGSRHPRLSMLFSTVLRSETFRGVVAAERPFVEQMGLTPLSSSSDR